MLTVLLGFSIQDYITIIVTNVIRIRHRGRTIGLDSFRKKNTLFILSSTGRHIKEGRVYLDI